MATSSFLQRRIDHHHKVCQRFMGTSIIFRPGGIPGNDLDLTGINNKRYIEINEVQSIHPIAGVIVSLIQDHVSRDPDKGDQLIISGITYNIIEYMQDGHDDGKLVLHRAT